MKQHITSYITKSSFPSNKKKKEKLSPSKNEEEEEEEAKEKEKEFNREFLAFG